MASSASSRARTEEDAPPTEWLIELPEELLLRVLKSLDDFSDCAAFSLASPRLGLLAQNNSLVRFKDPLFAVAIRLLLPSASLAHLARSHSARPSCAHMRPTVRPTLRILRGSQR
jgi:hypothetical protein